MIVLFDGECNFCNRSIQFIYERDGKGIFRFASLQSPKGKELLEKHHLQNLDLSSMVLINGEKAFIKSSAALRIFGKLRGLWPIMVIFLAVPRFIRNWVYNGVAKRRNRLVKEKCVVPSGEFKERFIG